MNTPESSAMQFFTRAADAWDAMYADCDAARRSIFLEQYILTRDEIGRRFLRLFAAKAAQGVQVRLVLDAVGSGNFEGDQDIEAIRTAGGVVEVYNPKRHFLFGRLFPRDHCKTLLVDEAIAYTGSACMDDKMTDWRDTQVRFTNAAAVEDVRRSAAEIDLGRYSRWKTLFRRTGRPEGAIRYIINKPYSRSPIYKEMIKAIRGARQKIDMVTPYLLLPTLMRRALRRAARRGVRIRIMVSERGDVPFADAVSRSYFKKLMRMGAELWLYRASTLHAKYVVIDDAWATVGSTNLDYLSLFRNREGNLIIRDPAAIATLRAHFADDIAHSMPVDTAYIRGLPWWYKWIGYGGRIFKRYL